MNELRSKDQGIKTATVVIADEPARRFRRYTATVKYRGRQREAQRLTYLGAQRWAKRVGKAMARRTETRDIYTIKVAK